MSMRMSVGVLLVLGALAARAEDADEEMEFTVDAAASAGNGSAGAATVPPRSGNESPPAGTEAARAGNEAARAGNDAARAGNEAARAGNEAARAGNDAARGLASHLKLSGYIQVQYQSSQASEDQLQQGGGVMNQDRFIVRRGRVRLTGAWEHAETVLELDASTTRGSYFGVRRAEVAYLWRNEDPARVPHLRVGAGLVDVPFGLELRQGQDELLFMERSAGSLAFFPGPPDAGVRVVGAYGPFRLHVGVFGGTPLDDRAGAQQIDPTRAPDIVGRVGVEHESASFEIAGGVSWLTGTGFSPGTDATKNLVVWRDLNENGSYDTGELFSSPGVAARPSETFARWAVNADFSTGYRWHPGWLRFAAEATMATNLDRGLFVADPVLAGRDLRELALNASLLQDLFGRAFVGVRWDLYDPDADFLDARRGVRVVTDMSITTISPTVGAYLPYGGRLVVQYSAIQDAYARDARGVPTDLRNDLLVARVQMPF